MASDIEVNWVGLLNKFSSYEGTIVKFCKENGVKPHQLYYHRKKATNTNPPLFHGIKVNAKDPLVSETVQARSGSKEITQIRVEIGKAKIYIPSHDMPALENILQFVKTDPNDKESLLKILPFSKELPEDLKVKTK